MTKKKSTFLIAILAILLAFTFTFTSCESDPEKAPNQEEILSAVGDSMVAGLFDTNGTSGWTSVEALSCEAHNPISIDRGLTIQTGSTCSVSFTTSIGFSCEIDVSYGDNTPDEIILNLTNISLPDEDNPSITYGEDSVMTFNGVALDKSVVDALIMQILGNISSFI